MPDNIKPIYETGLLGNYIKVFPKRIIFKEFLRNENSISINQIASISLPSWGATPKITIETTGGQKYILPPAAKVKEVRDAIYKAQDLL